MRPAGTLAVGRIVTLRLDGRDVEACVKRVDDGAAGLEFTQRLTRIPNLRSAERKVA